MKKISISKIVDFNRSSEKAKLSLIKNLNNPKTSDSGGDYWISAISAMGNALKNNDNEVIKDKIVYLSGNRVDTPHKITKTMYGRNLDILNEYEDFDFSRWLPNSEIKTLAKSISMSIIDLEGLPVQIRPSLVYTYTEEGTPTIGAVWFVAKLNGYSINELSLFTESLYQYLKVNYSEDYNINKDLCIAVDVISKSELSYSIMKTKRLRSLLTSTLKEIRKIA